MDDDAPHMELEDAEGRMAQVPRAPKAPTPDEVRQHEATHIPYRSWCAACVRGKGRKTGHRKKALEADGDVPVVAMDYHFLGSDDNSASEHPMLTMTEVGTGNCFARIVPKKGLGPTMSWLVPDMIAELRDWGLCGSENKRLVARRDGEPSIKEVRDALAR